MTVHVFRCSRCSQLNRLPAARPGVPNCGACKAPLDVSGAPQAVGPGELREAVARAPVPVLVDFWAPWCGPCRSAAPILERLSRQRAGRLLALKLDTQEHPSGTAGLGIQGIPTFIVFRGGREVARQVGLPPPNELASWIDAQLVESSAA